MLWRLPGRWNEQRNFIRSGGGSVNFLNSQDRIRLVMVGSNDPDKNRLNKMIHRHS